MGNTDFLAVSLLLMLHYLERVDRCGYPNGLDGDDILLGGVRIISLAGTYDSMTLANLYRKEMNQDFVIN